MPSPHYASTSTVIWHAINQRRFAYGIDPPPILRKSHWAVHLTGKWFVICKFRWCRPPVGRFSILTPNLCYRSRHWWRHGRFSHHSSEQKRNRESICRCSKQRSVPLWKFPWKHDIITIYVKGSLLNLSITVSGFITAIPRSDLNMDFVFQISRENGDAYATRYIGSYSLTHD